jgi:hypothetical protein
MMFIALKRGDPKMSGVTKFTLVTRPEQLLKVEAGLISILMGANLRKPVKDADKQITDKTRSEGWSQSSNSGGSTDDWHKKQKWKPGIDVTLPGIGRRTSEICKRDGGGFGDFLHTIPQVEAEGIW